MSDIKKEYKYKGKRKPSYFLDARKTYCYGERKVSWGVCIDWRCVPSEATKMYNKTLTKQMTREEYMERLVQHKLAKWERKHPQPCPNDDLFKDEYLAAWNQERDKALERFRDVVVSMYDKLHVVGNRVNRKKGKMIGTTVAEVKDVNGKGHNVYHPNLKESDKLYKDATKAAQDAMDKDASIVDCDLKNHKGNQKRPLIHAKRDKAKVQNLQQRRRMKKVA